MKFNKLISEDGEYISKGSIGMWISLLIMITVSILFIINKLNLNKYNALMSSWTYLIGIFVTYKGALKTVNRLSSNGDKK